MEFYVVTIMPPAKKYLKKILKRDKILYEQYKNTIKNIAKDPYIGKLKTGDLAGIYGYDIFHQGARYELAYDIFEDDNGDSILILLCGPRENFYDDLKRYLKTRSKTF